MKDFLLKSSKWLNVVSNIAFPVLLYGKEWYVLVAAILLMLGSGWMHYEEEFKGDRSEASILADWRGMYVLAFAVLASITNLWVLILIIPFFFLKDGIRDILKIGMVVLITVLIAQSWLAMLFFGLAYGIRQLTHDTEWESLGHAIWHVKASLGFKYI